MEVQEKIAKAKASVAQINADIAGLKSLEISLQNCIRFKDHESRSLGGLQVQPAPVTSHESRGSKCL